MIVSVCRSLRYYVTRARRDQHTNRPPQSFHLFLDRQRGSINSHSRLGGLRRSSSQIFGDIDARDWRIEGCIGVGNRGDVVIGDAVGVRVRFEVHFGIHVSFFFIDFNFVHFFLDIN